MSASGTLSFATFLKQNIIASRAYLIYLIYIEVVDSLLETIKYSIVSLRFSLSGAKHTKNIKKIDKLLLAFRERKATTVKTVQKVAGALNFICAAIPAGKVLIVDLYKLTRSKTGEKVKGSHHRRISRSIYEDLLTFKQFLQECEDEKFRSIPFLVQQGVFNHQIQLFADSAGAAKLGFGCVYGNQWAFGSWADTTLFQVSTPNIALLELFAIVMAVELWAPQLAGQRIILRSDNTATVAFLNTMKSEVPVAQKFLKHLALNCMHFQLFFKAIHIEGQKNILSDLLSRGKIKQFKKTLPTAVKNPAVLPSSLWPPRWSPAEMVPKK